MKLTRTQWKMLRNILWIISLLNPFILLYFLSIQLEKVLEFQYELYRDVFRIDEFRQFLITQRERLDFEERIKKHDKEYNSHG